MDQALRTLQKNWPVVLMLVVMAVGAAGPLAFGMTTPGFYVEVMLGGLMSGVMYSLVALGFVLIFKASGGFNFAQGAMVLIEHDMSVVMDISDRVVVLDYGRKIGDGTPDEVRSNEQVIAAYLGVAH